MLVALSLKQVAALMKRLQKAAITLAVCLAPLAFSDTAWTKEGFRKKTHVRYYAISGHDERSLLQQMQRRGPRVGGKPALARTRMQVRYKAQLRKQGGACRMSGFQGEVTYTITLPRLRRPHALNTAIRKRWQHFHKRLRSHEKRHIAIWDDCLRQVRKTLPALRARDCPTLRRKMRGRYRKIMQACGKRHDAFDAHEQHVATSLPFIRTAFSRKAAGKTRKRLARRGRIGRARGRR